MVEDLAYINRTGKLEHMDIKKLSNLLDKKFEVRSVKEDWSWMITENIKPYLKPSFLKNPVGLMLENSNQVERVFTACFPSNFVIDSIIQKNGQNSLLVVKHPFNWDGLGEGFIQFSNETLAKLKENTISIYSLHTPFDKIRDETDLKSTSVALAKKFGFDVRTSFLEDPINHGLKVGVVVGTSF